MCNCGRCTPKFNKELSKINQGSTTTSFSSTTFQSALWLLLSWQECPDSLTSSAAARLWPFWVSRPAFVFNLRRVFRQNELTTQIRWELKLIMVLEECQTVQHCGAGLSPTPNNTIIAQTIFQRDRMIIENHFGCLKTSELDACQNLNSA